MIAKSQKPSYN